ncbi:hypothetical protein HYH03_003759 [Edaphochlamys debaryana]|uniref:Uncharacterized protein n=1 Tax=Edaphochlamys debaryana TaxID=47281 RepID=A0A836C444_9CHLO|nr:hypothetical protein HYH03_003759 [Edaphochlamys debaryana]|eukprot:KAG2498508.1 hypothetical protein HYH03_003759 [Edaphochlamys debaryana]
MLSTSSAAFGGSLEPFGGWAFTDWPTMSHDSALLSASPASSSGGGSAPGTTGNATTSCGPRSSASASGASEAISAPISFALGTGSQGPQGPRRRGRKPGPKLPDLEARLAALKAEHSRLSADNTFMSSRVKVLEVVVPQRADAAAALAPLLSRISSPTLPSTEPSVLLASFCSGASSSSESTSRHTDAKVVDQASADAAVASALCPGPDGEAPPLTADSLQRLRQTTPSGVQALWRQVCMQLGVMSASAQAHGPGSPAAARLARYLAAALSASERLALLAPAAWLGAMYTDCETGCRQYPGESFWATCVRSAALTPAQIAEAAELAAAAQRSAAEASRRRQPLAAALAAASAPASASAPAGCSGRGAAEAQALASSLASALVADQRYAADAWSALCSSVLSPLQVARVLSAAYPFLPDPAALLSACQSLHATGASANSSAPSPAAAASSSGNTAANLAAAAAAAAAAAVSSAPSAAAMARPSPLAAMGIDMAALQPLLAAALQAGHWMAAAQAAAAAQAGTAGGGAPALSMVPGIPPQFALPMQLGPVPQSIAAVGTA